MWVSAALLAAGSIFACNDDEETKDTGSFCGDGVCDADETIDSCPEDCDDGNNGDNVDNGDNGDDAECGNGVCEEGESPANCPEDCEADVPEPTCGDGVCDSEVGEDAGQCPEDCDPEFDDGRTCTAVYDLDVIMEIADTPGGLGDVTADGLDGQLALRFGANDGEEVPKDNGLVEVLHLFVQNEIQAEVELGADPLIITTDVNGFTPTCNGETELPDPLDLPDSCDFDAARDTEAQASGRYASSGEHIQWHRCHAPPQYNSSGSEEEDKYTPDHQAEGPGCLANYASQGNVHCSGNMCALGGLDEGDNPQNDTWNQPLAAFNIASDATSVSLEKTHLPNFQDGNTYLSFNGTLTDIDCEDGD